MNRFIVSIILTTILIPAISVGVNAQQSDGRDISGLWEASTPEGSFKLLSVQDMDNPDDYVFLMVEPGETELEFGFRTGELYATLTPMTSECWSAEERFRMPLWAGGGFYFGQTEYCMDSTGGLQFHTDDEAAVFTDYPLEKLAGGIDVAGRWRTVDSEIDFEMVLYPVSDGSWQAILAAMDEEEGSSNEVDLEAGDVLYRGENEPDSGGVDASAWRWGTDSMRESNWMPMTIFLDDQNLLRIIVDQGSEMGTIDIEFERVY